MTFARAIYCFCYYYFPSLQYICDVCICNVSLYFHLESKSHSMAVLLCGGVYMPMKCFGSSVPSCPKPRLWYSKKNKYQTLCIGQNVQLLSNSLVFIYGVLM